MSNGKDFAGELRAMAAVLEALTPLDHEARIDVLRWVVNKLEIRLEGDAPKKPTTPAEERVRDGPVTQSRPGTVNTVAMKVGADSCRTLLIAAALHLTLYQGKESFSRTELVGLARSAKVWKSDYTNQTSTMISRLADAGTLVEKAKDIYFLSDQAVAEYEPALT